MADPAKDGECDPELRALGHVRVDRKRLVQTILPM